MCKTKRTHFKQRRTRKIVPVFSNLFLYSSFSLSVDSVVLLYGPTMPKFKFVLELHIFYEFTWRNPDVFLCVLFYAILRHFSFRTHTTSDSLMVHLLAVGILIEISSKSTCGVLLFSPQILTQRYKLVALKWKQPKR